MSDNEVYLIHSLGAFVQYCQIIVGQITVFLTYAEPLLARTISLSSLLHSPVSENPRASPPSLAYLPQFLFAENGFPLLFPSPATAPDKVLDVFPSNLPSSVESLSKSLFSLSFILSLSPSPLSFYPSSAQTASEPSPPDSSASSPSSLDVDTLMEHVCLLKSKMKRFGEGVDAMTSALGKMGLLSPLSPLSLSPSLHLPLLSLSSFTFLSIPSSLLSPLLSFPLASSLPLSPSPSRSLSSLLSLLHLLISHRCTPCEIYRIFIACLLMHTRTVEPLGHIEFRDIQWNDVKIARKYGKFGNTSLCISIDLKPNFSASPHTLSSLTFHIENDALSRMKEWASEGGRETLVHAAVRAGEKRVAQMLLGECGRYLVNCFVWLWLLMCECVVISIIFSLLLSLSLSLSHSNRTVFF